MNKQTENIQHTPMKGLYGWIKGIENGAEAVMPPNKAMERVGLVLAKAPGGVLIGFSGPSDFE